MNPASKDIANILDGVSSLGLTLNTDLFHARMPDGDDFQNAVNVLDIGGEPPMLTTQRDTSNYYYSAVSIQVRNTDYDTGYGIAFDIMGYLHAQSGITEAGTLYTLIKATNDPQLLGWDDNDRPVFVVNYEVQRRSS